MSNLLRDVEVAAILALSKQTLANWRSAGKGPTYVKILNGAVRYPAEGLQEFIESQRVRQTNEQ